MAEDKEYLGSGLADWVGSLPGHVSNFVEENPGVKNTSIYRGLRAAAGAMHWTSENVVEPLKQHAVDREMGYVEPADPLDFSAGVGNLFRLHDAATTGARNIGADLAENIGVDPRIGSFAGETAAEALATAGLGKTVKIIDKVTDVLPPGGMAPALAGVSSAGVGVSRGSIRYQPPTVMEIKGARPGSRGRYLTQDEFDIVQPERIREIRDELDEASEVVQNIEEANPGIPKNILSADGSTGYKKAVAKKEELQAKLSSEESNIATPTPDNAYAFPRDSPGAKQMKAAAAAENIKLGRSIEVLEMHHLIPKGISAAVYNRARYFIEKGEATLEDLHRINAKFKKATGSDTGDLASNIQPTRTTGHKSFHGEMRYQPSLTFKGERLEISKEALTKQLNKVKTYKEFEALLDRFIADDIVPLVNDARNWEKMDDILREINPGVYTGKAKYTPPKSNK